MDSMKATYSSNASNSWMAGDTIEISAKAFYNMDNSFPGKSIDVAPIVGAALAGMANPVSGPLGEASQLVNNTGAVASHSTMLPNLPQKNNKDNTVHSKALLI